MADALITKLGATGQIVTRPTRAIQKYQNTSQDPRTVGREQSVDAVLDGRIQRAGDRVRVTAQLIRVADGMQLWADTFDEEFTNMFAVEDAVSAQVASSIRLELTGAQKERLARRPTTSSEAYQSYLRGRYFWNERTGEGLRKGLDYFRHAIDLDPTYAEAYAGMADSYAMLGLYTVLPPNETFPKAKAAAIEALQLDSALAEAHATLGFVHFYYDWDGSSAEKEFATALQENPNYAMAHSWRGFNLAVMGRLPEAITEARLAQAADPLSAIIGTNAAWVYFLARQSDRAVEIVQKVIEIDPNFPRAHFRLGNIYENEGQYHRAIAEYEKAVQLSDGDTYYQASLGHAYAMSGMVAEAEKCLQHLEQLSAKRYVPPYAIALIYVGMGQKDHGLQWLERASADRSTSMAYLRVEPTLDSLRSEARFESLVHQTNF
jgi:tetratricopeptide (TPR) repeat protein